MLIYLLFLFLIKIDKIRLAKSNEKHNLIENLEKDKDDKKLKVRILQLIFIELIKFLCTEYC